MLKFAHKMRKRNKKERDLRLKEVRLIPVESSCKDSPNQDWMRRNNQYFLVCDEKQNFDADLLRQNSNYFGYSLNCLAIQNWQCDNKIARNCDQICLKIMFFNTHLSYLLNDIVKIQLSLFSKGVTPAWQGYSG